MAYLRISDGKENKIINSRGCFYIFLEVYVKSSTSIMARIDRYVLYIDSNMLGQI